ncbi:MAG: YIP1 family protein [Bryobacteraceae bacterium]|nr:YIP1 family protein [Bryobacteraceae bacterium]
MNPDTGQEAVPLSEGQRLTGVFHSPGAVFGDIAKYGKWIIPLLIMVVISLGVVAAIQSRVPVDLMIAKIMETNERMQQMSAEQRDAVIAQQTKIIPIGMYAGALLGSAVILFIAAGALLFIFNLLMDGKLKYKNALNIYSYAMLPPGIVGSLVMMLVLYLKAPDEIDIQNPLAFNAGAFLPVTSAAWLRSMMGSLDLFTFWTIFLLAVGFARAIPKMTTGRAFGAILIPWFLWVLVKTGWAAMFG